ncbi:MAG: sigma-54 dependent transcriptional regulator, partial [Verrucomicrobia bacterium]|nr:sigma-54 dependent transcriptional regulator [Verrucomicrobiota bacterium]
GNSLDRVEEIRADHPGMAIVLVTAEGSVDMAVEAMRRGVDNFLCKPVNLADLEVFLRKGLEFGALRKRHLAHQRQVRREPPYIGRSPAWRKMMELAAVAARGDGPVLLEGETGAGKGVLARWIHEHSPRRNEPYVEINCSSLRGELLASELFGHARGAFTSAVQDKPGLLELADGGTLFLDEIGDMDLAVQAQFLKVIEEKRFRRIGEVKERSSRFGLICATNHDLNLLCRENLFRQDLFFRVNLFPIHVPSLRETREDLPGLIEHLLRELGAPGALIPEDVRRQFAEYRWPGNIRELRNVLERALLLAQGKPLEVEHFPGMTSSNSLPPSSLGLNPAESEAARIRAALHRFGGNKGKAAEALGISRATLYRRLKARKT